MFDDRADAGRRLARALRSCHSEIGDQDVVVLALPRGGVPVGAEVAAALGCPLDIIVVRKLGVPWQPELAMGAIGENGARVIEDDIVATARVSTDQLAAVELRERRELAARVASLRAGRERTSLAGKIAVIVDDGIATGATARVACAVARQLGAAAVIVAVPVAPPGMVTVPGSDDLVCVATPSPFIAVGVHYRDFSPPGDAEVTRLLSSFHA
ncbi:MAG TPA: phosphoribosyltransferase family protein [Jatrophihabitantaceae bacterium]|jgi:putative phosphoribosyl transferase|nr:phosphoribosyltransferase family protein [Jatrophihabitantaceae bacterium]